MARVVNIASVMILYLGQSMNSSGSSARKGRGGSWVVRWGRSGHEVIDPAPRPWRSRSGNSHLSEWRQSGNKNVRSFTSVEVDLGWHVGVICQVDHLARRFWTGKRAVRSILCEAECLWDECKGFCFAFPQKGVWSLCHCKTIASADRLLPKRKFTFLRHIRGAVAISCWILRRKSHTFLALT
jgi:hypothetical protein